ncbi:MAG: Omp28-related outer membrane protein [Chitinophagales bacterium]|nr:Omp28-related outer membrane protein [Bacteroidota bacterium]MBK7567593.1 Omp28-related outer membrane protein [Bacteroidota bacterium]MBP8917872.1 Omp28-related outer membrane protein [Chitinophagales bacterium]
MKNNFLTGVNYLLLFGFIIVLQTYSCKEVGPAINLSETDYETYLGTPQSPDDKVVLIEDFTGAACVNCPDAHEAIALAIAANPTQVLAIAEYNYFGDPLYLDQNFLTVEAEALDDDYLGPVVGHPASFMDRVDFSDDGYLAEPPTNIVSYTNDRLSEIPPCNIVLSKVYDAISRELTLTVTIDYTSDVSVTNHLSVSLLESGIIAAQITDAGEVEDYEHNHVLRKMLTYYSGDNLPEENVAGRGYIFTYSYILDDDWNADNMSVVAFVHNFEADDKEVLQAAEIEIID